MTFSWRTPGVEVTPPTAKAIDQPVPVRFSELRFNPQGVYDLRRMLGALPDRPGAYTTNQARFDAADVAWFAAGCSTDGKHTVPVEEFHPVMERMYKDGFGPESRRILKEKVQKLMFDLATLWDRAFGGSTMVIHVDPTTIPGTPTAPEYLKASVYLPPSTVIAELPDAHAPLADIVQSFIVNVGLHTKIRWERNGKNHLGWKLKQTAAVTPLPLPAQSQSIPSPCKPGGSVYVFHGRPFDSFVPSAPSAPSVISNASTGTSATVISSELTDNDMYADDSDDDMFKGDVTSSFVHAFDQP
ncbi:hypothetical protein BJ912DRAFT_935312 [Pholiota molesta]|nr:hypothetical protein BJ912DRAFT_935312 [Pholiota molesta]